VQSRFWLIALTLLVILPCGQSAKLPSFGDYPVVEIYSGDVKLPDFGDPGEYRGTDLRCFQNPGDYTGEQVNFAGHFVIAACRCGSGCHYLFMWDAQTGELYRRFPFGPINIGPYVAGAGVQNLEFKGEQHHPDSALLIVDGCIEDTCDCATRYYHWNGKQFKLIQRQRSRIPARCS
jgi:hypothetical protein